MIETLSQTLASRDRTHGGSRWHGEPRVEELLKDPMLQLMMRRDRVAENELEQLIAGVRQVLRQA